MNQMLQTAPARLGLVVFAVMVSAWIMVRSPAPARVVKVRFRGRRVGVRFRVVRSLAWQALRQARPIWVLLAVLGLVLPGLAA